MRWGSRAPRRNRGIAAKAEPPHLADLCPAALDELCLAPGAGGAGRSMAAAGAGAGDRSDVSCCAFADHRAGLTLYRFVQEGLTSAFRHAEPRRDPGAHRLRVRPRRPRRRAIRCSRACARGWRTTGPASLTGRPPAWGCLVCATAYARSAESSRLGPARRAGRLLRRGSGWRGRGEGLVFSDAFAALNNRLEITAQIVKGAIADCKIPIMKSFRPSAQ